MVSELIKNLKDNHNQYCAYDNPDCLCISCKNDCEAKVDWEKREIIHRGCCDKHGFSSCPVLVCTDYEKE